MLLAEHLTVKGLAAGLFSPVAETSSCLTLRAQLTPRIRKGARGVCVRTGDSSPVMPRTVPIHGRALGYNDMPWTKYAEGKPLRSRVRSLGREKVLRLPSKPSQSRIGCDRSGVPWLLDLERTSKMLTS